MNEQMDLNWTEVDHYSRCYEQMDLNWTEADHYSRCYEQMDLNWTLKWIIIVDVMMF